MCSCYNGMTRFGHGVDKMVVLEQIAHNMVVLEQITL